MYGNTAPGTLFARCARCALRQVRQVASPGGRQVAPKWPDKAVIEPSKQKGEDALMSIAVCPREFLLLNQLRPLLNHSQRGPYLLLVVSRLPKQELYHIEAGNLYLIQPSDPFASCMQPLVQGCTPICLIHVFLIFLRETMLHGLQLLVVHPLCL